MSGEPIRVALARLRRIGPGPRQKRGSAGRCAPCRRLRRRIGIRRAACRATSFRPDALRGPPRHAGRRETGRRAGGYAQPHAQPHQYGCRVGGRPRLLRKADGADRRRLRRDDTRRATVRRISHVRLCSPVSGRVPGAQAQGGPGRRGRNHPRACRASGNRRAGRCGRMADPEGNVRRYVFHVQSRTRPARLAGR